MDREKECKEIIGRYSPDINKSINHVLENIYNAGWHDGRHAERDRWSKCEYLIIAPDKMDKIAKILDNPPCKNCEFSTTERLTGCLAVPQKCEKYQEYSLLCELIKYFKTCAYKS